MASAAAGFYEQAKHCQGLGTNFTVALWPSNGLLAILKKYMGYRGTHK
jgi:hypothetical protein